MVWILAVRVENSSVVCRDCLCCAVLWIAIPTVLSLWDAYLAVPQCLPCFHFSNSVLCRARVLNFYEVRFVDHSFGVKSKDLVPNLEFKDFLSLSPTFKKSCRGRLSYSHTLY